MKHIKQALLLLLAAAMLLSIAACGKEKPTDPNVIDLGDCTLRYKSAYIANDASFGEPTEALVLTFDFTNTSDDTLSYMGWVTEKLTQNGEQLEVTSVFTDLENFVTVNDAQFTDVNPGETIEVSTAFELIDTTTPVEVELSQALGSKTGKLTVDPSTLEHKTFGASASEPIDVPTEEPTGDALLDWWNGDWYGYWIVPAATGEYESLEGGAWACCAKINIGTDYTGTLEAWDADMPRGDGICDAEVSLSADGLGERGTLYSEGGWVMDADLAHADWIVDPALSGYDNMIVIDGYCDLDDGDYSYKLYLRPWGTEWDDVAGAGDPIPEGYADWYLALLETAQPMPDSFDAVPPVVEDDVPPVSDPNISDYGKSGADAEGYATLEAMQAFYAMVQEHKDNSYHLATYEDVRDRFGSDGIVWQDTEYQWGSRFHSYKWENGEGDFLYITFELGDGEEWYSSCTYSSSVKG